MKEDEKYFLIRIFKECKSPYEPGLLHKDIMTPRELIAEENFPINRKRATYILEKWDNKGLYEYGTSIDFGWLTEKGIEAAKESMAEQM